MVKILLFSVLVAIVVAEATAAAPNLAECPTVDEPYCRVHFDLKKALNEVLEATAPDKRLEVRNGVVKKTMEAAESTINKAYADVDPTKKNGVLAAYDIAANAVIAAAPAEKLKVLKEAFPAAAAAIRRGNA